MADHKITQNNLMGNVDQFVFNDQEKKDFLEYCYSVAIQSCNTNVLLHLLKLKKYELDKKHFVENKKEVLEHVIDIGL